MSGGVRGSGFGIMGGTASVPSDFFSLLGAGMTKEWGGRPSLSKPIQASLIRPILRRLHESRAHWVKSDIGPFFVVVFIATNLCVPIAPLPDRLVPRIRPVAGRFRFPVRDPGSQGVRTPRSTKEMDMVRHQQVITDDPSARLLPRQSQEFMDLGRSQGRFLGLLYIRSEK